jgi:hypothetical protein
MLPYKFIHIQDFDKIQQDLAALVPEIFAEVITSAVVVDSKMVLDRSPGLQDFLQKNNLEWDIARFFMTAPRGNLPIHVDGTEQYPKFLALNLPVCGCEGSAMNWWDQVELTEAIDLKYYGDKIRHFDSPNKVRLASIALTQPALVQINVPHSVDNDQDHTRVCLSIRFKTEPVHLWHN